MRRLLLAAAVLCTAAVTQPAGPMPPHERRMSFSNRQLLNRAVVSGLRSVELLLLVAPHAQGSSSSAIARTVDRVSAVGGRIKRTEPAIGYLRVEVPIGRLLDVLHEADVDAYQISSLSRGTWYRDGPSPLSGTAARALEITPVDVAEPKTRRPELPVLSVAESRAPGFTADDSGVGTWLEDHPTFDGRGVTIALLEHGLPSFTDPAIQKAKTVDGREVAKIAGILNAFDVDPRWQDETRVILDAEFQAPMTWTRVGNRTYILPRPGTYHFGTYDLAAGTNVVQRFAVVEDARTHDVWIDTNGDGSFEDEKPLADVNERFEPGYLTLQHPAKGRVAFVMARGRRPHVVHIYVGRGSHQSMTISVAAGSRTDDSLAFGVAPNARVLLVRMLSNEAALGASLEGFIDAAQRADVDVIGTSWGTMLIPDTDDEFSGAFFRRLTDVYQKVIINSAGNRGPQVASADGSAISVGGVLSPATWSALYGGRPLDRLIVHRASAAGPSIDGAIKPDFLAPMERLSADLPWNAGVDLVPQSAPTHRLPPGYQVSCCTSASSPYAAGVAALLISAARQSGIPHDAARLSQAMRLSARLLRDAPAHLQGNGLLEVEAAWRTLQQAVDRPRFTSAAMVAHPLAQYAARGNHGVGIFEFEGWTAGGSGTRTIVLTRESGPAAPLTYRVAWAASDGSFSTPASIALPLRQPVPLPVHVDVKTADVHSGLLELRDEKTAELVFRTQATVVGVDRVDAETGLRITATVENLSYRNHYMQVPAGTTAISFELEIARGIVMPTIVPAHGLFPSYYFHVHPNNFFFAGKGKYVVRIPNPQPGTWTFQTRATSTAGNMPASNPDRADDGDVEYILTVRVQNESMTPSEPALDVTPGYLTSHRSQFLANGLPNTFDIEVPQNAAALSLQLRAQPGGATTELHLYDCTTGECFSYNVGFPAASAHTMVVRKPNAGRWVAAVNAAPFPSAPGSFVLDEVVTIGTPVRRASAVARGPRSNWSDAIADVKAPPASPGKRPVVVVELIDAAAERAEADHPWSTAANYTKLRDRPIALATAIYPR